MESLVSIRDLGVRYDGVVALEHVNLDIYADDFIGVIGPNGGGKSSLVKAIMGVASYTGRIEYAESLYRGNKPHIGYLPQISSFDKAFPISVREVVMSGLQHDHRLFGRYRREDRMRAEELLERVALADRKSVV